MAKKEVIVEFDCKHCGHVAMTGKDIADMPHAFQLDGDEGPEELQGWVEEQHGYCKHRPEIYDEPDTADMHQHADWDVPLSEYVEEYWGFDGIPYGGELDEDSPGDQAQIETKRERVIRWIEEQEAKGVKPEEMDEDELRRVYYNDEEKVD